MRIGGAMFNLKKIRQLDQRQNQLRQEVAELRLELLDTIGHVKELAQLVKIAITDRAEFLERVARLK